MLRKTLNRREALALIASLPALAQSPANSPTGQPSFSDYPFQLGVASGDPAPDGFVLWTRLAPQPLTGGGMTESDVAVQWQVAKDEALTQVVAKGEIAAKSQLAHSVHVEVNGLDPDHWYFYQFKAGSEVSPVARARTAPAASTLLQKLRFSFASCQHYESGYFTALRHMADEAPDLIVHLGDYIYEGAARDGQVRKHTGKEIHSLEDYRNRHALYRADADLQAAHHACPWLVTWDDHEFDNNYADRISEEAGIDVDQFLTRRAHSYQAYYEHMPLRLGAKPVGHDMLLYRRVPYGRLIDFAVLDTRQYRSDQPCGDKTGPECPGMFDPNATLLGAKQEQWLQQTLRNSPSVWNCIAQQVLVTLVDRIPGEEKGYSMDQWSGYRPALDRFTKFLAEAKPSNPVVLTGDIHANWVGDIASDFSRDDSPTVGTEFVGTSITSGGDGEPDLEYAAAMTTENRGVRFFNRERGYVSCEITPKQWRADYQVVEYVSRKGAPKTTRASFVVEDGKAGAREA